MASSFSRLPHNLPQLEALFLTGNKIKELSPLAGLKSLRWLFLGENPLEDISALFELHPDLAMRMSYPKINPKCGHTCVFKQLEALNARIITSGDDGKIDIAEMHNQEETVNALSV